MEKTWQVSFVIREGIDYARILADFAGSLCPEIAKDELLSRRSAIHEALINAVKYGGTPVVLKAEQSQNRMTVRIKQANDIVWPQENQKPYKGVALIKRFAQEYRISADKKTLSLVFVKN